VERRVVCQETLGRICPPPRRPRRRTRVEEKRLIKSDITRNAHPTANGVPTPITLVLITVGKKHTLNRLSGQFGALARGQKNIENTTKGAKS
jgi:hypothetical protein